MDVTGYAVIGAGAVLLLVLILAWLLRSRRRDRNTKNDVPAIREEPTLVPKDEESSESVANEALEAVEAEAAEAADAPEVEPATQPGREPTAEPVMASAPEPEPDAGQPEIPSVPQPKPEQASVPDSELDPAFVAARAKLDEELQAGHFSRLDVFEDYQRAAEKAYGHIGPRSEYFSRVVNEAIAVRDAFEALLDEEDRARFVEGHGRYLDEVSVEADEGTRVRMHREQIELLRQLRPKAAAKQAEA